MQKFLYNFRIGLEALSQNRLRALLTSLGIIFGVASVIAMLAIGRGAQEEILEQMTVLGVNNIIVNPIIEQEEGEVGDVPEEDKGRKLQRYTPGLTLSDAQSMAALPAVAEVSPEIELDMVAIRNGRKRSVKLVGVQDTYFSEPGFALADGQVFQPEHMRYARSVCIVGSGIVSRFFGGQSPIGKQIKVGKHWLTVIGVLKPRNLSREIRDELGIRNFNLDVYTPVQTVLLRYVNRSLVTRTLLKRAQEEEAESEENGEVAPPSNYHQLDRLVVRVSDVGYLRPLSDVINRMLARRHNQTVDFEIVVPELLLKQRQEANQLFNLVLGAIASISLIVGGIGIMNIMLASVLERIKEIGLRMALGATRQDIVLQFISEAVAISVSGGLIGIALGLLFSYLIRELADIQTVVSGGSIILSFVVATSVGLIFGIYPARRAARQDPVVSLRSGG